MSRELAELSILPPSAGLLDNQYYLAESDPVPDLQEEPPIVTLHMYGHLDGTWITLSDSRTTKHIGDYGALHVLREDTVKYLTYPEDPTTWKPGDFAAIVMTYGRSDFARPDSPVLDGAISVMRSGLHSPHASPISSLGGLVDALWRRVKNRWYDCCKVCALAHSEANDPAKEPGVNAPVPSEVDEYLGEERESYLEDGCDHSPLSVVAIGINPADDVSTLRREWGTPHDTPPVSDRKFRCSEHHTADILVSDDLDLHEHREKILDQLGAEFDRIATESRETLADGSGDQQTAGPIGGHRSGWTLSPADGFTRIFPRAVDDDVATEEPA